MKYLRNIKPHEVIKITDMINHSGKSIASKALIDNDHTEIRFFSFPKGESISKEYYEMETLFIMLEGSAKIVYNKVFNKSVLVYFKKYLIYLIMTLSAGFITTIVCNKVVMNNEFFTLVFKGIICIIIPNTLYLIVVFKTNEFKYIKFIIIDMIKNKFNNRSSKGELNEAEIKKNSNLG